MRFDIYKSPLDDVRVRPAIHYAIERKGLIGTVNPATYQIAQKYVMPTTINGFDPNVQPYEYNPERA
nr:ABC transporter substrate-binding protein [Mesorhizobium sp. M4A.F.Ca.ET.050.02.1.1]